MSVWVRLARVTLFIVCVFQPWQKLVAQGSTITPEQQRFSNEIINESVNTTTLFASQDTFSTGRFAKHRIGQPDTSYNTIRTPFETLLTDGAGSVQPFVQGSIGLLKVVGGVAPVNGVGENDLSTSDLISVATGLGAYVTLSEDFKLAASISLAYSHLRNNYDFKNEYSQKFFKPEDDLLYNWSLDLLTYTPTIRALYQSKFGESIVQYTLGYSHIFNDSIASSSSAITINSATGLLWNRFAYTQPLGIEAISAPLSLRPFFQWSNISGKASKGLDLVNLFEVGADLVMDFKEKFIWFSQISWGGSYVTGDSFEGYHIGLGGKF